MLILPEFRPERCVRYRYSYSACSRCSDVCPHEAIKLSNEGVEVLADHCKGCALCAWVCPTEALAVSGISAEQLLKQAGDAKQMTIACAPSSMKGDVVVPCIGAINPMVLAEFARRGIALRLEGTAHCGACINAAKGPELIDLNLLAYQSLCDIAEPEQWVELERQSAEAAPFVPAEHDASRRGLFRRIVSHGTDVASGKLEQAPAPLKAIRAAAPFLPERKTLLNGLFAAAGDEAIRVAHHAALPAEDWEVAQGCTYCEACVRVCPTGAIQLLESNTAWRLAVLNDRCVGCDVCAEVCQPGVLRPINIDTVIVNKQKGRLLAAVAKRRCARCDRVFVNESGAEICPICSGDDGDFAEIFG